MFSDITSGLINLLSKYNKKNTLSKSEIDEAIEKLRSILIDADVINSVVQQICTQVSQLVLQTYNNASTKHNLSIDNIMTKHVHEVLSEHLTCPNNIKYAKNNNKIMMIGSVGSGKTTTVGKIGRLLCEKYLHASVTPEHTKVSMEVVDFTQHCLSVCLDFRRARAFEQLKILSARDGISCFDIGQYAHAYEVIAATNKMTSKYFCTIYDTSGIRYNNDADVFEMVRCYQLIQPSIVLLVLDGMSGKEIVHFMGGFIDKIPVDGTIITKMDGEPRGGVILSLKHIFNRPVLYICDGEKTDDIRDFDPSNVAASIIGLGDIQGLSHKMDKAMRQDTSAQETLKNLQQGYMTIDDLLVQMKLAKTLGGIGQIGKMLGISAMPQNSKIEQQFDIYTNIAKSMTKQEKHNPDLIATNYRRKQRIAHGSGVKTSEVERMMKYFHNISHMVKQYKSGDSILSKFFSGDMPKTQ